MLHLWNKRRSHHSYGQKHTKESKKQISKSLKGKLSGENHPQYDTNIYQFEHKELGIKICTKYELRKEFNLDPKCLALLCRNERTHHKGWKMIRCVSGTDSQLKQKQGEALPLGESVTLEAQPIGSAVGG